MTRQMTGAKMVIQALKDQGVDTVFGYPGGAAIDKLAQIGDPKGYPMPKLMTKKSTGLEFSFSGLKTAVLNIVREHGVPEGDRLADLCASFQACVAELLVRKTRMAAKQEGLLHVQLCGGVAANSGIRNALTSYNRAIEAGQHSVRDKRAAEIMQRLNSHPAYKTEKHMAGYVKSEGVSLYRIKESAYFHELRRVSSSSTDKDLIKIVDGTQKYMELRRRVGEAGALMKKTGNDELFKKEFRLRNKQAAELVKLGGAEFGQKLGMKPHEIKEQAIRHRIDHAIDAYKQSDKLNLDKGRIALDIARNGMDASGKFDWKTAKRMKIENITPQEIKKHALNAIKKDQIKSDKDADGRPSQAVLDREKEAQFRSAIADVQQSANKRRNAFDAIEKDPVKRMAELDAMEKEANKIIQNQQTKEAVKTFEKAVKSTKAVTKVTGVDFDGP